MIKGYPPMKLFFLLVPFLFGSYLKADENAGDYGALRIENEYKIAVPTELTETVWKYLAQRYQDPSPTLGAEFQTSLSDEYFLDTYFDNDDFKMLKTQSGIRLRRRFIPGKPDHAKNERKLIQVKLQLSDGNDLNRGEMKYPVISNVELFLNEHFSPIGLIDKKKNRDAFANQLSLLEIEPLSLKNILTLTQRRRRVYLSRNGKPFATMTLDEVATKKFYKSVTFTELELELNEIAYTEGTPGTRSTMEHINEGIKKELFSQFPALIQDQTPKYNKAFSQLEHSIPFFKYLIRWL